MLNALRSIFPIIFMIGLGFVLTKKKWFEGDSSSLISRIVLNIALPAFMVSNLLVSYDKAKLLSMLPGLPVPFVGIWVSFAIAVLLGRIFRVKKGRRGVFACMFTLSNGVFIGVPLNLLLFGDASLPYSLFYYIANTTTLWTLGSYGIAMDAHIVSGRPKPSLISLSGLRRILSPPLLALLFAVVLIVAGITLPKSLLETFRIIGNMTTPLSMIFIGIMIARVDWKKIHFGADINLVMAGRFLITPLILYLFLRGRDFPLMMKQVLFLQSTMPVLAQTPILAAAYGADSEYAGLGTSISTVLGIVVIPLFMSLVMVMF
ncbi:MAG: AEC family transporter [Rectinemataceae bacterium]|nr:AEC family transporter [Rectinemataceae bacterium]